MKGLGGSVCRIVYAARRPADPVKFCPFFILRRFLPRTSYFEIRFCGPFGALRLSARLIGGGWFYSESMILSRIDYLIPHNIRELRGEGIKRKGEGGGGMGGRKGQRDGGRESDREGRRGRKGGRKGGKEEGCGAAQMPNHLAGWVVGWLAGWLVGCLAGWLAG